MKRETRETRKQEKMLRREAVRAFEDRVERGFVDAVEEDVEDESFWNWLWRIWWRLWRWG